MTRVVLASASAGRLGLLRQAGVDPIVIASEVDENAVIAGLPPGVAPGDIVTSLAVEKAIVVTSSLQSDVTSDCVVIGCDSMLQVSGALRGKPATVAAARAGWNQMAGTSGELWTGHCLIRMRGGVATATLSEAVAATVRFGSPSPDELEAYLDCGEPLQVAGGFTADHRGSWFVDSIDGNPGAVIGICLPLIRRMLAGAGVSLTELWRANQP